MEVPQETNLLPTRPVIYSGGAISGSPGVVGSGTGGQGGPSSHVARWGEGGLISGERRGLTVTVDSLDVLHQEIPKYPPAARAARISGEVVVDVVINEKGVPIEILVVRSDHIMLTPTVMEVAPRWRFTPVLFGGNRVRANFRVCFRFILETS
jgi:protein TonB